MMGSIAMLSVFGVASMVSSQRIFPNGTRNKFKWAFSSDSVRESRCILRPSTMLLPMGICRSNIVL